MSKCLNYYNRFEVVDEEEVFYFNGGFTKILAIISFVICELFTAVACVLTIINGIKNNNALIIPVSVCTTITVVSATMALICTIILVP